MSLLMSGSDVARSARFFAEDQQACSQAVLPCVQSDLPGEKMPRLWALWLAEGRGVDLSRGSELHSDPLPVQRRLITRSLLFLPLACIEGPITNRTYGIPIFVGMDAFREGWESNR